MPSWFYNLKDFLECLSYLVTIIGIIAIVITVIEFNTNSRREKKQEEQLLIQNSINVLKTFAEKIIPEIEEAHSKVGREIQKQEKQALKEINNALPKEHQLSELPRNLRLRQQIVFNSKTNCNYGKILNQLEQVSVYMNYGMVKEDLVYLPIHKVFIDFVSENIEYLKDIISDDAPYANIITLYNFWNNKNEEEKLRRKKKEIENKLKQIKKIGSD